jgi:hypothetical protein
MVKTTPPVQVPYVPKVRTPEQAEQPTDTGTGTQPAEYTPPVTEQPPVGEELSVEQMQESLKNKYLAGGISEETYISLKKELKDKINGSATSGAPVEIDNSVKQLLMGQITEDEYKRMREIWKN